MPGFCGLDRCFNLFLLEYVFALFIKSRIIIIGVDNAGKWIMQGIFPFFYFLRDYKELLHGRSSRLQLGT